MEKQSKIALITGGSRGIGLGIARSLASEGFNLVINGMREEKEVEETLNQLRTTGVKVIYVRGDISKNEDRIKIVDRVREEFGILHVLVNNAGVAPLQRADILDCPEDSFKRVIETNLNGTFFMSQLVANWMIEIKKSKTDFWACIINISSVSSTVASVNRGEYCISKAGISMTTKLFAARLGEFDLPVYEIQPGIIQTDMTSGVTDKYTRLIEDGLNIQTRWGIPDDVGKAAASLARGDLSFSTGQIIYVDGGLTIPRL